MDDPYEIQGTVTGRVHTRSNFADVRAFHEKFELGKDRLPKPGFLPEELNDFRSKFMAEELDEYNQAVAENDLPKAFDALLDLVYVALGTADLMNLPWQSGWNAVQRANMSKVRARRASDSLRGSTFDVVKPAGWTPPDIDRVLEQYIAAINTMPQVGEEHRGGLSNPKHTDFNG